MKIRIQIRDEIGIKIGNIFDDFLVVLNWVVNNQKHQEKTSFNSFENKLRKVFSGYFQLLPN